MPETITLKLIVYPPGETGPAGIEYDLTIVVPDAKTKVAGHHLEASAARCDVVPVTGQLEFPNPAAPVISPFTGLMFIYDDAPAIGFPLTIMAQGSADYLPFNMNLCFPASPVQAYSGAIKFGQWPGPCSDVTAAFLSA